MTAPKARQGAIVHECKRERREFALVEKGWVAGYNSGGDAPPPSKKKTRRH